MYFNLTNGQEAIRKVLSEGLSFGATTEEIVSEISSAKDHFCDQCFLTHMGHPPCDKWGQCKVERTFANCSRVAKEKGKKEPKIIKIALEIEVK